MLAERILQNYIARRLKEDLGWEIIEWGKGVKSEGESLEEVFLKESLDSTLARNNFSQKASKI
ncbi:MAG: hypothetical protein LZ173_08285 [Thaumarchaeota archaeon]|jgi:hypothetical protein|nr:hypothetical protein [Candidatus Geocrenenecus arthurdayi]